MGRTVAFRSSSSIRDLGKELRLNYRQGYFAKAPEAVTIPSKKRP